MKTCKLSPPKRHRYLTSHAFFSSPFVSLANHKILTICLLHGNERPAAAFLTLRRLRPSTLPSPFPRLHSLLSLLLYCSFSSNQLQIRHNHSESIAVLSPRNCPLQQQQRKGVGVADNNKNGQHLTILPLEPKLGKMLILGAILNCLDPVLTVVAGLSVRDHFLMPLDKIDLAEAAKSQFSNNYSDQLVLVRAYEGWKDAARDLSGYECCWENSLSTIFESY